MDNGDLSQLAVCAKSGDREAEEQLYFEMGGTLLYLAHKYNYAGAELEDALQEGFIAIAGAIESFNGEKGGFKTYCSKCITNRLIDGIRASRRDKSKLLNDCVSLNSPVSRDNDEELVESIASGDNAIDDELIRQEEIEELRRKIELKLTLQERNVLAEYLDGMSYQETADKLGLSVKAVDNTLSRIKKKLR